MNASGRRAYFPNNLQHRPEAENHILTLAMGSVCKHKTKLLKDLSFVVFTVNPPMSQILLRYEGERDITCVAIGAIRARVVVVFCFLYATQVTDM